MAAAGKAIAAIQELMKRGVSPNEVYRQTGMKQGIDGKWAVPAVVGIGATAQSEQAEAGVISKGGRQLIESWHGTPHSFDKFDMSQLGSGEGAQAYGRGLYTADSRGVADSYRSALEKDNLILPSGDEMPISEYGDFRDKFAFQNLQQAGNDYDEAIRISEEGGGSYKSDIIEILSDWKADGTRAAKGNLYKVHIDATPDDLLDWDAPLSSQPQRVKDAFNEFAASPKGIAKAKNYYSYKDGDTLADLPEFADPNGDILHNLLGNLDNQETMKRHGVKGIQYNDAMSRDGKASSTKNYVTFDDKLMSIVDKYGVSGLSAGGLLGLGALPEQARASSTGTIEAAKYPMMQTAADYMDKVEVPIIGKPLQGIADWARGVAYDDPDKLKRAAIGALDLM